MVLALCLSLLPASALAATAANGSSLTELGDPEKRLRRSREVFYCLG